MPGAADLVGARRSQALPRDALRQSGRRPHAKRLAARHLGLRIEGGRQVVALFEKPALSFHHPGFGGDVGLHVLFEALHRLLGVQGIAVEVETEDLTFLGLSLRTRRMRRRFRRREHVRLVVCRFLLLGASRLDGVRCLRGRDGVGGRRRRCRLLPLCLGDIRQQQDAASKRADGDDRFRSARIEHGAISS